MTKTSAYLGVDIARETLACFLAGESFAVRNTPQGHRQVLARVRADDEGSLTISA